MKKILAGPFQAAFPKMLENILLLESSRMMTWFQVDEDWNETPHSWP